MAPETTAIATTAPANAPEELVTWVAGVAELTQPDAVYWCDGSEAERDRLYDEMVAAGTFIQAEPGQAPQLATSRAPSPPTSPASSPAPSSAPRRPRTPAPPTTGPTPPR